MRHSAERREREERMAGKADFTEEEWDQLRKGATGAGLLVSVSDRSFLDSLKEASSFAHYLIDARDDDSELVRELASEHGTGFGAIATPSEVQSAADDALRDRGRHPPREGSRRGRQLSRVRPLSRRDGGQGREGRRRGRGGRDRAHQGCVGLGRRAASLSGGAARARWPSRSSKPVRSCSPRLGRFDSGAAPSQGIARN